MRRLHNLTIRGKDKTWGFTINVDPKYLPEWRADGLEIDEIVNSVPMWVVELGIPVRLWCFFQDIFNFKNPFRG